MNTTRMSTRRAFISVCVFAPFASWSRAGVRPPLMLASPYQGGIDLNEYWVSEKFDGVRAYWNGTSLLTRAGHQIAAPLWFTEGLPPFALDGELWGGRGLFEFTVGVVRTRTPDDAEWRRLKYMVFDLPADRGTFDDRLQRLHRSLDRPAAAWLRVVPQSRVDSEPDLQAALRDVEALGGEGLVLHRGGAFYSAGRTNDVLKVKSSQDAEAQVVAHEPGTGKYAGMMGALRVRALNGMEFKVGSGFTERERTAPPPVGSWITYAHNGATRAGLPRFPRFVRVREDLEDTWER